MPALENPKHERFAQELAKGKTADEALDKTGRNEGEPNRFYVYVLIDPRDSTVFYVGKGKGKRRFYHLRAWRSGDKTNPAKLLRVAEIVKSGTVPVAEWIEDGFAEDEAYRAERRLMFAIGLDKLTNAMGAPVPEIDRIAAMAKENLLRFRPYCRMFRLSPPPEPHWEAIYWDCIGRLSGIARKKPDRFPPMWNYEKQNS